MSRTMLGAVVLVCATIAGAQPPAPASVIPQQYRGAAPATPDTLAAITTRNRALFAYDDAAWRGTDAVLALHPSLDSSLSRKGLYLVRPAGRAYDVAFGVLTARADTFLIFFTAREDSAGGRFRPAILPAPQPDTGDLARAARARGRRALSGQKERAVGMGDGRPGHIHPKRSSYQQ